MFFRFYVFIYSNLLFHKISGCSWFLKKPVSWKWYVYIIVESLHRVGLIYLNLPKYLVLNKYCFKDKKKDFENLRNPFLKFSESSLDIFATILYVCAYAMYACWCFLTLSCVQIRFRHFFTMYVMHLCFSVNMSVPNSIWTLSVLVFDWAQI